MTEQGLEPGYSKSVQLPNHYIILAQNCMERAIQLTLSMWCMLNVTVATWRETAEETQIVRPWLCRIYLLCGSGPILKWPSLRGLWENVAWWGHVIYPMGNPILTHVGIRRPSESGLGVRILPKCQSLVPPPPLAGLPSPPSMCSPRLPSVSDSPSSLLHPPCRHSSAILTGCHRPRKQHGKASAHLSGGLPDSWVVTTAAAACIGSVTEALAWICLMALLRWQRADTSGLYQP